MKEPIIVTAFWDVGRAQDCEIPRSNERYYKEFAEWSRIKNKLIVFTDKYSEMEIFNIRSKYKLQDKTIIIINDIFEIEKDLFLRMKKISLFHNLDTDQKLWKIKLNLIMPGL